MPSDPEGHAARDLTAHTKARLLFFVPGSVLLGGAIGALLGKLNQSLSESDEKELAVQS